MRRDPSVGQAGHVNSATRNIWANVLFATCIALTVLNGVVVGYGAIWFQIGGSGADAEDYQISAGGYGAAAFALLAVVPGVLGFARPRVLALVCTISAVIFALLAVRSAGLASEAYDRGPGINSPWDGIGGVLLLPWSLALVVLGVLGVGRLARPRR